MMRWISSARSTLTDEPRPVHVPLPEGGQGYGQADQPGPLHRHPPRRGGAQGRAQWPARHEEQQAYIQRLRAGLPPAPEELLEYEDYQNAPTQGHANAFIRQVQEDFAEPMSRMENYLD